jgi:hypothetical protein
VDEDVASGDARLDALRRRVYQRGAPPEAAREYAAALALQRTTVEVRVGRAGETARGEAPDVGPTSGIDSPAVPNRAWTSRAGIAGLAGLAVLAAILTPHSTGTAGPSTTPGGIVVPAAVLPEAPPVPGLVLATLSSVGPSTSGRLDGHGRTVLLASLCDGDGTVSIHVSDGSTTVLACGDGIPALVMVPTAKPLGRFTVTTSSQGHPHWTLTVGTMSDAVT